MAKPKAIGTSTFWTKFTNFFSNWQWRRDNSGIFSMTRNVWYGNNTVKIDCEEPLVAYNDCPHFQMVIEKKAEMFANGQWKCYAADDDELENPIDDDEGLKLLRQPNPLQSGEEFLKDHIRYKSLFANEYIYRLTGSALTLPKVMWYLPTDLMEVELTGKIFDQYEIEGIIKKYILTWGAERKDYSPKDVIYIADNFSLTEGKGKSKVPSLKLPINNIIAALKTRNILTVNKGIIGFISNEAKDAIGSVQMTDPQREAIEKQFEGDSDLYSDKAKIKITNSSTKWNNMSFPIKDLMLLEECEDDFQIICAAYGVNRRLFGGTKDATYENQKESEKSTYQSCIQPEADSYSAIITKALKGEERKRKYVLDYSWLPIMQANKQEEEEADSTKRQKLSGMLSDGIISPQAYADAMGVEMTGDGIQKGNGQASDKLGKIPLALQQLANALTDALAANDTALAQKIKKKMDLLLVSLTTD